MDLTPLASAAQFQRRFPQLCEQGPGSDLETLVEIMLESTDELEKMTSRRLAPFTNHYFSDRLSGIDPSEYGNSTDSPLDIYGSLGLSKAQAFGDDDLVRVFFLDQYAVHNPELWTYSIGSINLRLTYGNTIAVQPSSIQGPEPDTGWCRFRIGTFAPEGTEIEVVYSGGFTVGIPPSLQRACLYVAAQSIVQDMEPQLREGLNMNDLDNRIERLIAPWVRA